MQRCDSVIVCFPLSFLFSSRKGYFLAAAAAAVVYYRSKLLSARLITIADLLLLQTFQTAWSVVAMR